MQQNHRCLALSTLLKIKLLKASREVLTFSSWIAASIKQASGVCFSSSYCFSNAAFSSRITSCKTCSLDARSSFEYWLCWSSEQKEHQIINIRSSNWYLFMRFLLKFCYRSILRVNPLQVGQHLARVCCRLCILPLYHWWHKLVLLFYILKNTATGKFSRHDFCFGSN